MGDEPAGASSNHFPAGCPLRYNPGMTTSRTEAFSDGVIAVIITIMVLELHAPHEPTPAALLHLLPGFLTYVLSFIYIGIYWNNHHHLFQASKQVSGGVLWANLHLLFWLSLIPFVTSWMDDNHLEPVPVAAYGAVLFMNAVAFMILGRMLRCLHGEGSTLRRALSDDRKEKISLLLYAVGVGTAFKYPVAACVLYAAVAGMWFIPDRRIEKVVEREGEPV